MIKVENLCFQYHGQAKLLQDVSFGLEEGQFLAILGNNGVGKSTLLKCFNHILTADSGRVLLDEEDLLSMSHREIARRVAFVSQTVPSTRMTVHDTVMLGRRPYMRWGFTEEDHAIIHRIMTRLDIDHMRGRFLSELSGGERQKVMLARALAQQPKVLLLDEPTSSLDIRNQYQVLQTVSEICQKDRISAMMVIHDLNLALRFCTHFLLMRDGQVYRFGDHTILDAEAMQQVYGVDAKVVKIEDQYMVLVCG